MSRVRLNADLASDFILPPQLAACAVAVVVILCQPLKMMKRMRTMRWDSDMILYKHTHTLALAHAHKPYLTTSTVRKVYLKAKPI